MEFFFTKEQHWLDKWDVFSQNTNRGLYNQLSDWIKSYEVYGFDYNFLLVTHNDTIVAGCGIVIAKFSLFKFFIVPSGPVINLGYENVLDTILEKLKQEAITKKCCYFQISLPYCDQNLNFCDYNLDQNCEISSYFKGLVGVGFKYVIPLQGFRIVNLSKGQTHQEIVSNYSSNHKRNLLKAKQNELTFKFVISKIDIKDAYNCFVMNALDKGYPLRSYESVAATLQNYIDKDFAKIGCCYYKNLLIGAIYVLKCGNRLIYINGGVFKEYQHYNASVFMHNQMIQYSIEKKYESYDLSVGGSKGVIKFKEGFGTQLFTYVPTRNWILNPLKYNTFKFLEKYIKPHKQKISSILLFLKKIKK